MSNQSNPIQLEDMTIRLASLPSASTQHRSSIGPLGIRSLSSRRNFSVRCNYGSLGGCPLKLTKRDLLAKGLLGWEEGGGKAYCISGVRVKVRNSGVRNGENCFRQSVGNCFYFVPDVRGAGYWSLAALLGWVFVRPDQSRAKHAMHGEKVRSVVDSNVLHDLYGVSRRNFERTIQFHAMLNVKIDRRLPNVNHQGPDGRFPTPSVGCTPCGFFQ